MSPFRVTWNLRGGFIPTTHPIHLDGLLGRAAVGPLLPDTQEEITRILEALPLERLTTKTDWTWKCSVVMTSFPKVKTVIPFTRPCAIPEMSVHQGIVYEGGPNVVTAGTGHNKAFLLSVTKHWVSEAYAWGVGDIDAVRSMLQKIPALGKWTRNGAGIVDAVEVVPVSGEEAQFWSRRRLPIDATEHAIEGEHFQGVGTLRGPYWMRCNETPCLDWAPSVQTQRNPAAVRVA